MLLFVRHFSIIFRAPLWKFSEMQCVYTLWFYFLPIFWGREFTYTLNNKYCIVITPVEKSLQSVDCAWQQKQHTMFTRCWLYRTACTFG